jgi:predicted nucleic acid-binding protein
MPHKPTPRDELNEILWAFNRQTKTPFATIDEVQIAIKRKLDVLALTDDTEQSAALYRLNLRIDTLKGQL